MNHDELGSAIEEIGARILKIRDELEITGNAEEAKLREKNVIAEKMAAIMELLSKRKNEEAFMLFAPELAAEIKTVQDRKAVLMNDIQRSQIKQGTLSLLLQNEEVKLKQTEMLIRAKEQGINLK